MSEANVRHTRAVGNLLAHDDLLESHVSPSKFRSRTEHAFATVKKSDGPMRVYG